MGVESLKESEEIKRATIKLKKARQLATRLIKLIDPDDLKSFDDYIQKLENFIEKSYLELILLNIASEIPRKTTTLEIDTVRNLSDKLQEELHNRNSLINHITDFQEILKKYLERSTRARNFIDNYEG